VENRITTASEIETLQTETTITLDTFAHHQCDRISILDCQTTLANRLPVNRTQ
jgi:hypothetical protein